MLEYQVLKMNMGDCQQGLSINNVEKIALWHRVVAKMLSYHIS